MSDTRYLYGDEDENDDWVRSIALPEEYIIAHHPSARGGYYRWFESPNVVDLVRIRRLRAKQTPDSGGDRAA
jgi:hypothetical protein